MARDGEPPGVRHHVLASIVASLTAAIGCAAFGAGSMIALLAATIAGTTVAILLHRRA